MKQRLTSKQLQELTDDQKERLRQWWNPQEGDYITDGNHEEMIYYLNGIRKSKVLPLLWINQMIELLHSSDVFYMEKTASGQWYVKVNNLESNEPELVDALWEVLKHIL